MLSIFVLVFGFAEIGLAPNFVVLCNLCFFGTNIASDVYKLVYLEDEG